MKIFLFLCSSFLLMNLTTSSHKVVHDTTDINSYLHQVELLIYSGTENPKWTINNAQYQSMEHKIFSNKYKFKPTTRVMGYKGFRIISNSNGISSKKVKNSPLAEFYLLSTMKENLPKDVMSHIYEQISSNILIDYAEEYERNQYIDFDKPLTFLNNICDNTPIRGPDMIPDFNPQKDDYGCFEEMQWHNNCYNYGNDIVTNTFAQPGRGSGSIWQTNTCEDVRRAAESDGLKWVGTEYPADKPEKGHYIALLIWPETNFHWVRLDSNGKWSHKPGGTEIQDTDNTGSSITDPSKQDFSPWSQFCGYFLTVPSQVSID